MKILHTSDWHLGHVLYGYDRLDEQADFLGQIAEIVRQNRPDAMVIAGDIFHYSNPTPAAQRVYTDGLLSIRRACPSMTIIVSAGNHDSGPRLEVDCNLWAHLGVHVIGRISRANDDAELLDRHIIEVCDAKGQCLGFVVAVPHVYPRNFPPLGENVQREQRQACFFQVLLDRVNERNVTGLPVVLSAHLAVSGSNFRGHDESIGGMEWVPLSDLGVGYDYLALGHIHCPQFVPNSHDRARYCGTPLAVSFDEDYAHSVSIVEVEHGQVPQVRTIEIVPQKPLKTVPDQPLPFAEALNVLRRYPQQASHYIRLQVLTEGTYLPGDCMEQARDVIADKACQLCLIKIVRPEANHAPDDDPYGPDLSIDEFRQATPIDIAQRYYKEHEGEEMSEDLCDMIKEVVHRIEAGQHGDTSSDNQLNDLTQH